MKFLKRRPLRTVAIAGLGLTFGTLLGLWGCGMKDSVRQDAIASILADPTRYEGRVVTLRGFVNLERDGDAIYMHVDDYRWGITANAIWLHMPQCANRAGEGVRQGYMTVVGNFTAKLHGSAENWVGEIDDIKFCRLIEGVPGDPRPRPVEP